MIGDITMSKRLSFYNIKNSKLKKMLLDFEKVTVLECEVLNEEFNQARINNARERVSKREHELVIYLNNRIEK